MKNFRFLVTLLVTLCSISLNSFTQSTVPIRGDTIRIYKQGDTAVAKVDSLLYVTGQQIIGKNYSSLLSSASLDLRDSTRAIILNRMWDTSNVVSPVNGMLIYQNSNDKFYRREAGVWEELGSGGGGSTRFGVAGEDDNAYAARVMHMNGNYLELDSLSELDLFGVNNANYFNFYGNNSSPGISAFFRNVANTKQAGMDAYPGYFAIYNQQALVQLNDFNNYAQMSVYSNIFRITDDSTLFQPTLGKINIDSLRTGSSADEIVTWRAGMLMKVASSTFTSSTSTGYGIINTGTGQNPNLAADTSSSNGLATQYDLTLITGGSITDGDKGDIDVTASGATWTVDTNVINNVKFRQSGGFSVVGRDTATTGNVADITANYNEDVLFRNGDRLSFGKPNLLTRQGNAIGDLLYKTSLADTTGLTCGLIGSATYTISGSKLNVVQSSADWTYVRFDSLTSLDVIQLDAVVSFNSFAGDTYVAQFGIFQRDFPATNFYSIYGSLSTRTDNGTLGRLYIISRDNTGAGTTLATSASDLSMSATDSIQVRFDKFENTITFSARNLTTNSAWIPVTYTLIGTQTSHSVGDIGIVTGKEDYNIHQFKVSSKQVQKPNVYLFGDSKFTKSTYQNESLAAQLKNNYNSVYANCAVGSTTADLVANRWEVINLVQPKKVLIAVSNDIRFGVSSGTWQANLTTLYDDFTAAGIDVYFTCFYETSADQSAMDTWLAANYPTKYIRRVYTDLASNTGVLLSDNIHLSAYGNKVAYDAIVLDGKLETLEGTGGFTQLEDFTTEDAWTTGYINGSGDYTPVALGTATYVWTSNGASSAPSWQPIGGATINSGVAGKPTYYTASTTLDDFAAVDYATSGDNVKMTALNTGDNILFLQGIGSQTGEYIKIRNSLANAIFDILSDGKVGIGDATPQAKLQVGSDNGTSTAFGSAAQLTIANGGSGAYMNILGVGTTEGFMGAETNNIIFGSISNDPITFRTNNTQRLAISNSGVITIASVAQDDTETKILVWNSTDDEVQWRDASTLGGGSSNLSWDLTNHEVDISGGGTSAVIPYAAISTDGLVSSATQSFSGAKTFDDAVVVADAFSAYTWTGQEKNSDEPTPASGSGIIYWKNDGKLYARNDAGTIVELTAAGGTGSNLSWDITNHQVDIDGGGTSATIPYAATNAEGIISTATQSLVGYKIFTTGLESNDQVYINLLSASTNSVVNGLALHLESSGTPANGFGNGIIVETETTPGNVEIGARVEFPITDVTAASEDFDYVLKLMKAGAAATEAFRVLSTGELKVQLLNQDDAETKVVVWNSTDKIFEWRASSTLGGASGITIGTTTVTSGTNTRVLYNNSGVVGEYALGSGISTWWATPSSANLASAVTDETGTGALVFGTSPQITTGIKDANGNDMLLFTATTTAVNQFTFENATAANTPTIYATGTANVNFGFSAKGTGDFAFYGTTSEQAQINLFEDRDNGLDFIALTVPAAITGSSTITLPNATGTVVLEATSATLTTKTIALGSNTISGSVTEFNTALTGDDFATLANTVTLTNKRITKRTGTVASSATPTINTDNVDLFTITAQTVDITSMTTNLSGTPNDGDEIEIWITGTASRAITWGASFAASAIALPTTTSGTSTLRTKFIRSGSTWVIKGQY